MPVKKVGVVVAHPDDETLWAGGTILSHPAWNWYILSLCRASDPDRAPKFYRALKELGSEGAMGDLDDGPDQKPLEEYVVEREILGLLPPKHFDILITHNPSGEYTRHIRHEEVSRAVLNLWVSEKVRAGELWTFAYEDGGKAYLPRPVEMAPGYRRLPKRIWQRKYSIITRTYGFGKDGFEAGTTPRAESFWQFRDPFEAEKWLKMGGVPGA
jgi:LmbE family N-acetylglucosaminyl deacetylase